jgi:hypothetical protein
VDRIGFARGVRALRPRRRLTQDDLGGLAGVSRGVIARIGVRDGVRSRQAASGERERRRSWRSATEPGIEAPGRA